MNKHVVESLSKLLNVTSSEAEKMLKDTSDLAKRPTIMPYGVPLNLHAMLPVFCHKVLNIMETNDIINSWRDNKNETQSIQKGKKFTGTPKFMSRS